MVKIDSRERVRSKVAQSVIQLIDNTFDTFSGLYREGLSLLVVLLLPFIHNELRNLGINTMRQFAE